MNEYRPYVVAVQRWLPAWLLLSLVGAAVVFGVMSRLPPTYSVHFSYLVSLAEREDAPEYRFDGFYALQATDLFAATLATWISTPELIVAAYREAEVPLPGEDARRLQRNVVALKTAPQLIEVTVSAEEAGKAEHIAAALDEVVQRNVKVYQEEGTPELEFSAVATPPWTSVQRPAVAVIAASVFVVMLVLLLNAQLLWMSITTAGYARRD